MLINTNSLISTTDLKNMALALTIYINEQVAKKCNSSPTAKP